LLIVHETQTASLGVQRITIMAAYNVWLVSLRNNVSNRMAVATREEAQAISFGIQNGLIPIVQKANPAFDAVNVQWVNCPMPQRIQPHELLVYFVSSSTDTILRSINDVIGTPDLGGTTVFMRNGEHASEVFVSIGNSDLVARMAFHEIMHNKLRLGDTMHTLPIDRGGGGLARAVISNTDNLTQGNIDLMAAHLWDRHPQWTGGCSAAADHLRGLL
jgi:hypothetical protein